jgi:hypothetical protein
MNQVRQATPDAVGRTYQEETMRTLGILITLALLVGAPVTGRELPTLPGSAYLNAADIDEAIKYGQENAPQPYLVRVPGRDRDNIAIYTPFTRVALAAHEAKRLGKVITTQDLASWIIHHDVHVVVRWPHHEPSRMVPDGTVFDMRMPLSQITIAPDGRINPRKFVRPIWFTTDLTYLGSLGGRPFEEAAGAAGFPPELFVPNAEVAGWWHKTRNYFMSSGRIETDRFVRWR